MRPQAPIQTQAEDRVLQRLTTLKDEEPLFLLSGVRRGIREGSHCIHRVGDEAVNRMLGSRMLKEGE